MRTTLLLLILIALCKPLGAQAPVTPPEWWINVHSDWWLSGGLPWRYFITESSGYMGPNALPIPESSDASIPDHPSASISGSAHLSAGDQTFNSTIRIKVPFGKRVLFESWYIPAEYFQTDVYTRNIRYSLGYEGKGWARGDVYVSTGIQFLRNRGLIPDLQGRAAFKTASGTKYEEARFTDAPGYFFDLTSAWTAELSQKFSLRPFLSMGFYCWQIQHPRYYQNDALLYSFGLTTTYGPNRLKTYVASYRGYLNNGDRPMSFRADFLRKIGKHHLLLQYQYGLHDVHYDSYSIGYQFTFTGLNTNSW